VARSFSGDKKQLLSIFKAAIAHKGLSFIDVISPCVTFNDHEGSTKSYAYMKEHDEPLHSIDFVPSFEEIEVEIAEGETREVRLHDGSLLRLKKLHGDYDPTDKLGAIQALHHSNAGGEVLTGILYVDPARKTFLDLLDLGEQPLATLPESKTRPSREALQQVNEELR
jgi:2-oxoglutarate ferredoxin oxidoreductase subunit beta